MALASTPTLLSLDEWAALMGVSPYAFNQLDINELLGDEVFRCALWFQHGWQKPGGTLNREVVARAIADAEAMLAEALGYWPAPQFLAGEKILYPRPLQPEMWNWWYTQRWTLKDVRTKFGRLVSPGVKAFAAIDADVAVTFSDTDGDSVADWWTTAAIATTVTEAGEIAAYVRDADRPNSLETDDEDIWRLRPVRVDLDAVAGTVVLSGPIWLLVDPVLTLGPNPQPLDPSIIPPAAATPFLDGLKVQRRYIDQTDQGEVILEQLPCYDPPCATLEVAACFGERDALRGVVTPKNSEDTWPFGDDCCQSCRYAPDFVRIHYCAGYPLQTDGQFRMDHLHAQMVARLAATLLPDESCSECTDQQINYWRGDLAETLSFDEQANLFGTRRGALWAYKQLMGRNGLAMAGAIR